jgi:hypothetical protein
MSLLRVSCDVAGALRAVFGGSWLKSLLHVLILAVGDFGRELPIEAS